MYSSLNFAMPFLQYKFSTRGDLYVKCLKCLRLMVDMCKLRQHVSPVILEYGSGSPLDLPHKLYFFYITGCDGT